jgi:hypothetical protein
MRIPLHDFMHQFSHVANSCKAKDNSSPGFSHMDCSSLPQATSPKKREGLVASAGRQGFFCTKFAVCSLIPDPSPYTLRLYYCKALFFLFWSLSAICTSLYTGRSVSSCVQACRNQSFKHCSYEHTGSEDQDCAFQFRNVRPCPR